jgi:hypothetical protein
MIIVKNNQKYRPGEDETLDETILPVFLFNQNNYIPSRTELMDGENGYEEQD